MWQTLRKEEGEVKSSGVRRAEKKAASRNDLEMVKYVVERGKPLH